MFFETNGCFVNERYIQEFRIYARPMNKLNLVCKLETIKSLDEISHATFFATFDARFPHDDTAQLKRNHYSLLPHYFYDTEHFVYWVKEFKDLLRSLYFKYLNKPFDIDDIFNDKVRKCINFTIIPTTQARKLRDLNIKDGNESDFLKFLPPEFHSAHNNVLTQARKDCPADMQFLQDALDYYIDYYKLPKDFFPRQFNN